MEFTEARAKRWVAEAEGYIELGLPDEALARLRALAHCPHHRVDRELLLGTVHRLRGMFDDAIPHFAKALEWDPGNVPGTVGLGWCLKRTDRLDAAIAAYVAALERRPDEALLHYNLACYLSLSGQAREALKELARAIEIDEDFRELALQEEDFLPIRDLPEFQECLKRSEPREQ